MYPNIKADISVLECATTSQQFTCGDDKFGKRSAECSFKLDFGCPVLITGVELVNGNVQVQFDADMRFAFTTVINTS